MTTMRYGRWLPLGACVALMVVPGCANPSNLPLDAQVAVSGAAQTGSIRVAIAAARSTQDTVPEWHFALDLSYQGYHGDSGAAPHQTRSDLTAGSTTTFEDLPAGTYTLALTVTDGDGNPVASDAQTVNVLIGQSASVRFNETIGGSSAFDLGLYFSTGYRFVPYDYYSGPGDSKGPNDSYDNQFQQSPYDLPTVATFQLVSGDTTHQVTFRMQESTQDGYGPTRQVDDGPHEAIRQTGYSEVFWNVPRHAAWRDSSALDGYPITRHYRWVNTYPVPGSTENRPLTIDSWYAPSLGLVKQTVTDDHGAVVSTMTRNQPSGDQ